MVGGRSLWQTEERISEREKMAGGKVAICGERNGVKKYRSVYGHTYSEVKKKLFEEKKTAAEKE